MAGEPKKGDTQYLIVRGEKRKPRSDDTPSFLKQRMVDRKEEQNPPERSSSLPKVILIEPHENFFDLVEAELSGRCRVLNQRCAASVEDALGMLGDRADAVVIGFGFRDGLDTLLAAIRSAQPEAKIIKLAATSEYEKITADRDARADQQQGFDAIIPHRLSDLGESIEKECKKGDKGV